MRVLSLILPASLAFTSACSEPDIANTITVQSSIINEEGKTIKERFRTPEGYQKAETDGFGNYLRSLKLKPHGSSVRYFNGETKPNRNVYAAVVDMEIGNKDLQQCADAVMRLRGEYLFHSKQYDQLHFKFTNGFVADYNRWRQGNRISVSGNNVSWTQGGAADDGYPNFRKYMDMVFTYAGTLSLSRELKPVAYKDMKPGDVFIKGGSPGHAVIVVDMAQTRLGEKVYLLAQSYMPAQETQVLLNPSDPDLSPWYELNETDRIIETPELMFTAEELKRFE